MKVLAHRGFWKSAGEKNHAPAFERAFASGYGIETDIRDLDGTLVVSHDPPRPGCMTLAELLGLHARYGKPGTLALNIKADGLQPALQDMLHARDFQDYFVFDMSVPDSLSYFRSGMTVFTRRSEYEGATALDGKASGHWLDCFEGNRSVQDGFPALLQAGKMAALVSPELHGRPHMDAWTAWRGTLSREAGMDAQCLFLCTDYPADAHAFFNSHLDAML